VDHFRKQAPGGTKKMVVPDKYVIIITSYHHIMPLLAGITISSLCDDNSKEETITDAMRVKFKELTRMVYAEQAKWYLNGFWNHGGEAEAEEVWLTTLKFEELDKKKKAGNTPPPCGTCSLF
jgi:hypothetical protein